MSRSADCPLNYEKIRSELGATGVVPMAKICVLCACVFALSVCGGEDEVPAPAKPASVIGSEGGVVIGPDGTSATFPADVLRGDTTIRIAKDSSGAPPPFESDLVDRVS